MLYRLTLLALGAVLGVFSLPAILLLAAAPALADGGSKGQEPAAASGIYRYETAEGTIAFAGELKHIPTAYRDQARLVVPSEARWTHAEPARQPYRFTGAAPSYEQWRAEQVWGVRAEAARREIEDAQALEVLAAEIGAGESAAALHRAQAEARAERLEDRCRETGCLPGYLR